MSGDDELRAFRKEADAMLSREARLEDMETVVGLLAELAALRAKADAADRVRAVLDEVEDRGTNIRDLDAVDRLVLGSQRAAVHQIRAALDGNRAP